MFLNCGCMIWLYPSLSKYILSILFSLFPFLSCFAREGVLSMRQKKIFMCFDQTYNLSSWEIKTLSKGLPFPQLWQSCGLLKFAFFPICTLNMSKIRYKHQPSILCLHRRKPQVCLAGSLQGMH